MLEEDESLLLKRAKECKDLKEHERYLALHAVSVGKEVSLVAEIFCVSDSIIYEWAKRWQDEKTLADKPKSGRPPVFDDDEKKEMKDVTKNHTPKDFGINASTWTCTELREYWRRQGKDVSADAVRSCLLEMGAHYVKANISYAEADREKRRRFAQKFLRNFPMENVDAVLFVDEASLGRSVNKGYGWTFDERLVIKAPQNMYQKKVNYFGAVDILNGSITEITTKEAKVSAFIRFLEKVAEKYQGMRVLVFLDNLPLHKSNVVNDWLKEHPDIRLRFLPPYSPDLNPEEQWHGFMRNKLLNNRYFDSIHSLQMAVYWFCRKTTARQVLSICNLNPIRKVLED